ncbi:ataxin-10 [Neosynchiropus ocellatus]
MAAHRDIMDPISILSDTLPEKLDCVIFETLKKLTTALRDQETRDSMDEATLSRLLKILTRLRDDLHAADSQDQNPDPLTLQLTAECFRAQRNACVFSEHNQNLFRSLGFITVSVEILRLLLSVQQKSSDGLLESLRCGVQFLANVAMGNQECKDVIWQENFSDLLRKLLAVEDEKTLDYSSSVFHTCLDERKVEQLSDPANLPLALRVIELCMTKPGLDWTVLIATQHFMKSSALVEAMYSQMSHCERVTLLELLHAELSKDESQETSVHPSVAQFVATLFQRGCGSVLTLATCEDTNEEEALMVITLLDLICEMTSDHKQFMFLQDHPDLLVSTVELLKQVQTVGKAGKNIFSAAQDFSSLSGGGESVSSPVFGFKAHLIRLIGNLCYNHTNNQNKVRELDGLPLILDNCIIDSNNHFIRQWSIFAIRNLLEHNQQNQELVSSLEQLGKADYSALQTMGFQVIERDGKVLLKTARKDE